MTCYDEMREQDSLRNDLYRRDKAIATFTKYITLKNLDDAEYIVNNLAEFCAIARLLHK